MKHFGHTTATQRANYSARIVERLLYRTETTELGVTHFRCRCGRLVPEDMMLDLGPSGTVAPEIQALAGADRFRCDACWRRWLMRGLIEVAAFRANCSPRTESIGCRP